MDGGLFPYRPWIPSSLHYLTSSIPNISNAKLSFHQLHPPTPHQSLARSLAVFVPVPMEHNGVHPNATPDHTTGGVYPPLPTPHGQPANQHHHLGGTTGANSWMGNDANTLLVVATLITTLTYQLGTSIPGGYWQQDTLGTTTSGGKPVMYRAGDPIMRDLHKPRYYVFMGASWVGFASSMVMTLSLLVRMPVDSRHVRWSFVVAYSSLVLTFVVSQPRTHLSVDIIIWLAVLVFLWIIISLHPDRRARVIQDICCSGRGA